MQLNDVEQRILGCLIEKDMTTPDYYPLTLNALVTACNQTSNRDPVVSWDEATVEEGIDGLRGLGLCRIVHRPGQRTEKIKHAADEVLAIDGEQAAVLAVLLLRGDQTVGEVRTRTARYVDFPDLGDVLAVLRRSAERDEPLMAQLERRPGEKERRWRHLLGDTADDVYDTPHRPVATSDEAPPSSIAGRLNAIEARLDAIEARLGGDVGIPS